NRWKVKRRTQTTLAAFEQHPVRGLLQQIGALLESIDRLVERDRAATRHRAVPLALRTSVETAKTAKITVAAGLDQEHIELLTDHACAGPAFERRPQRTRGGAAKRAEAILRIHPERQIEIAAFVPHLDPLA